MESDDSDGSLPSGDSLSLSSDDSGGLVNTADASHGARATQPEVTSDYEMLSPDQLIKYMTNITQEVSQIINVCPTFLRLLLGHFKWDTHALSEFYFEHGGARTFKEAGIIDEASSLTDPQGSLPPTTTQVTCDICCDAHPSAQVRGLSCAHYFCIPCYRRYLEWKVMEESQIDKIYCPSFDCKMIIEDETVLTMLQSPPVLRRFQKLISNSFVQNNRSLTWCPGADCGYAVRFFGPQEPHPIECTNCGESFCFVCGQPWHDPVKCEQLKAWLSHVMDDSGTSNWIVANTKECPKCHATIEKSGGCNHMTCRNVNCKYEFCWLCLDLWEPHGSRWYNCNRFDGRSAKQARDSQANSRKNLERFLFYFNRYVNHLQSLRFEARLYESVQKKMETIQLHGTSWVDVQFFRRVVDILCRCRRTLMYTYAFAFFLKKNNHSLIFESNQSDLELATEHLSGLLERDISAASLAELKQKLQDKARYCETRRKVLVEHVHEGYEKDFWEQIDT